MNIWRPYTQMQNALPALAIERASGAFLYGRNGQKIFDGISSWWLITHGHCHPKIAEAISEQAKKVEQVVFANFSHEPAEKLAEALRRILPPSFNQLFFSDNGSTAVEVAMKMAFQYCSQTNAERKNKFLAFTSSYHGDTCGAMSASAKSSFAKPYTKMLFEVIRADQGLSSQDSVEQWVSSFQQIMETRSEEICAVLIEPLIQGAGGMVVWPIEAIRIICEIAKKNETLVIFDEVMTGFGRTGTMFAFEQIGYEPDFLCLSKGLTGGFMPMGLTVTNNKVFEAFLDSQTEKMFFHGHSFTGNALSCAAAVANLELFEAMDKKIYQDLRQAHIESHQSLKNQLPIIETRVCGTIGIIEVDVDSRYGSNFSKGVHAEALKNNLFIRPLGNTIYLMPPYCTTISDVAWAWQTIGDAVKKALES